MNRLRLAVEAPYGMPLNECMPALDPPRNLPAAISMIGASVVAMSFAMICRFP
jgi:hypothetical protein